MAGEALGNADVLGRAIEIGASRMSQSMNGISLFESSTLLPSNEQRANLSGREPMVFLTHEQRGIGGKTLAPLFFPAQEFRELHAKDSRQHDVLRGGCFGASFIDAQAEAPSNVTVLSSDIADIEGDNLVLAKRRAEGNGKQHMVAITIFAFSCGLEERRLLARGKSFGGRRNRVDEEAHGDEYTLCLHGIARACL